MNLWCSTTKAYYKQIGGGGELIGGELGGGRTGRGRSLKRGRGRIGRGAIWRDLDFVSVFYFYASSAQSTHTDRAEHCVSPPPRL